MMHRNRELLFSVWTLLLILLRFEVRAQQLDPPASDFNRHSIVQPIVHHGRTRREITSTRDTNGGHHQEVTMIVNVDSEEYTLDLRLNHDLVAADHAIRYQKDGRTVTHRPNKKEIDLCHYSGVVRDKPGSWVAVSTCRGVSGVIFDGLNMRYIEPASSQANGSDIQSKHYVYSHNDLNTSHKCGQGGTPNDTVYEPKPKRNRRDMENNRVNRYKRSIEESQVHAPHISNKESRYVELVLVADHGEYLANGGNIQTTHSQLIQLVNIINSLYSPLNIFIALVGVEVWTEGDRIQLSEDPSFILKNFHQYRKKMTRNGLPHDNAHLLTRQKFSGTTVGLASVGGICRDDVSGGIAYHHSHMSGVVASTIAHEMGHNFGKELNHYSGQCSNNSDTYNVHSNKPRSLFGSPTCGNGFVEPGEQCDCGVRGDDACLACCDVLTCSLRPNATCSAGECCDFSTCRLKSAGVECRSADKECDLPEYCTGRSEYCPDDVYKMNTLPCGKGDDQAFCMDGVCRSHNHQCRLLFGPTGSSYPKCYHAIQKYEDPRMDCGHDARGRSICDWSDEHAMCARISCTHDVQNRFSEITYHHKDRECPVPVDMGQTAKQYGLVPDGAKCGNNKMCMKQRCVSVESVRKEVYKSESPACPSNCSGHGTCNSLGRCSCEPGYEPPGCDMLHQNDPYNRRHDSGSHRQNDLNRSRQNDLDNRRQNDLDNRRQNDLDNRRQNDLVNRRQNDLNNRRPNDLDNRRQYDLDKRRQNDLNNRRQNDLDNRRLIDLDNRRQNDIVSRRQNDLDNRRQNDLDIRKQNDLDRRRQNDLDKRRQNDLDNRRQNDVVNRTENGLDRRRQNDLHNRRQNDFDRRRQNELDKRRQNDIDRRRQNELDNRGQNDFDSRRQNDLNNRRQNDLNNRRPNDLDNRRQYDLDKRRQNDLNNRRQNDLDNRRLIDLDNRRQNDLFSHPFNTTWYNSVNPGRNGLRDKRIKPNKNRLVTPRPNISIEPRWGGPSTNRQNNSIDPRWNDSVIHGTERIADTKPDLTAQRNLKIVLYVIFLGVLPAGIIAFIAFYYSRARHDAPRWWQNPLPSSPHVKGLFTDIKIPKIFNKNPKNTYIEQEHESTDHINSIDVEKKSNKADAETVRKITKDDIKAVCASIPLPVSPKPFVNPLDNHLPLETCIPFDKPNPLVKLKPIVKSKPFVEPLPLDKPLPLNKPKPFVHPKPVVKPVSFDKPNKPVDKPQLLVKPNPIGPNPLDNHRPVNPNAEGVSLTSITNEMLTKHRLRSVGDNRYKKL